MLTGDAPDGFEVNLRQWATVKGRVVDDDGDPIQGARIYSESSQPRVFASPKQASMRDFSKYPMPLPPRDALGNTNHLTDSDGRFELVGLAPGHEYSIKAMHRGNRPDLGIEGDITNRLKLKPGDTRDVGDVVLKASKRSG